MVSLKEFFEKVDFEKNQQMTKKHEKITQDARVKQGRNKRENNLPFSFGRFTFERIHKTKEQIFFNERVEKHKAKERMI